MSLAQLLGPPPTASGDDEYSWSHYQHHQAIINAVAAQKRIQLQMLQIWPFVLPDVENWLQLHQQMHDDVEPLFGIIGQDLSSLDWNDPSQREGFVFLNYSSHRDIAAACGVPI